jgi:hypothetical protein
MTAVTFDEWLDLAFGHPVQKPEWYWSDVFADQWNAFAFSDSLTVKYLMRTFLESQRLRRYSLDQVAQGIWFLIGESSPAQATHALLRPDVPIPQRIQCVDAIVIFFRDFVAQAAPGTTEERVDPFHTACYMWWDIFPTYGGPGLGEPDLHNACLRTMAAMLQIPSELCWLSALHGLNHWHLHYAEQVESIVNGFLSETTSLPPRFVDYARRARAGQAQ